MKRAVKIGLWVFLVHSFIPAAVFVRLLTLSDGTERWGNTLVLYFVDFPLLPVFLWFQDSPSIGESSFINTGISFLFGGLIYGSVGALFWRLVFKWRKSNSAS